MASEIAEDKPIDYQHTIAMIDPSIPRAFVKATINKIIVTDGEVDSVEFNNGLRLQFNR